MKKTLIGTMVLAFCLGGTSAWAHVFKGTALTAKNIKNLKQVVMDAQRNSKHVAVVSVPKYIVPSGKIGLTRAQIPTYLTPVTASLINYAKQPTFKWKQWGKRHDILNRENQVVGTETIVGRGFYASPNTLARDLHAFYGGKGAVWVGRSGRKFKFYALPVNGILYQPDGFEKPLVLNSEEYFVMYDIKTQQGYVVENIPSVYKQYTLQERTKEPFVQPLSQKPRASQQTKRQFAGRLDGIEDVDVVPTWKKEEVPAAEEVSPQVASRTLELLLENQSQAALLRGEGAIESLWETSGGKKEYENGLLLGQAVTQFYEAYRQQFPSPLQIRQVATGKRGYVYELPVEGLSVKLRNGGKIDLQAQEYVLLHFYTPKDIFMPVKRTQLEEDINALRLLH